MEHISSTQNPKIKIFKVLQEKSKKRKEHNQFVIEGVKEIQYALQAGYKIEELYVTEEHQSQKTKLLIQKLMNMEVELHQLATPLFKSLCYRTNTTEALAIAQKKEHRLNTLQLKKKPLILIAESPEKPGNIGALARTVDAGKFDALIITNPRTDLYNPNVIRSSVGCLFSIPIALTTNEEVFLFLKSNKIKLYSATLSQKAKPYTKEDFTKATAIAVGAEDTGLSESWCNQSDHHITIPMKGVNDSLNVSVAAGIILFEAIRQRSL
jgi:TrmH family RNA methyltransferase